MIRFRPGKPWLLIAAFATPALATEPMPSAIATDEARHHFDEAHALCTADAGRLWGVSLCGPILFVDPQSRAVVASEPDAGSQLTPQDGVFTGTLPVDQNASNTSVEWSGTRWTEMLWPLPDDARKRRTLITHELFHRIQMRLPVATLQGGDNVHLDTLQGRYWLQLEWRALAAALRAKSERTRKAAVIDALGFRTKRNRLFEGSEWLERALEYNEGLAEYTGAVAGNRSAADQVATALDDLAAQVAYPSFVRSFAYATGPAYGLLLDRYASGWRSRLQAGDGFEVLLQTALHVEPDPAKADARATAYDGAALLAFETRREADRQQRLAADRARFIDGPVLILQFQHMSIQFNPTNLQPLGDAGTVYPTMRVSDNWGVLDVADGALLKPDWSGVSVPAPFTDDGGTLKGGGWTLTLKPGWQAVSGTRAGDFELVAAAASRGAP